MAGDWLKMEANTPEKEEVLSITTIMGWEDPDMTVGKLFRLWRWFDQQTTDGNASRVTFALLDRIVGVSGFCSAVHDVGWLVSTEGGVSLPKFDRHNGSSAKSRAQTAKRVANHKTNGKGNADGNADGNAATVSEALPREEKRREEKSNSVTNVTGDKSPDQMTKDELWSAGKSLLSASMPAKQCGSFVGKLVKDYGDAIVIDAVRAAVVARPADPVEYIKATCMRAAGQRGKRQQNRMTDDERATFNASEAEKAKRLLFGNTQSGDVIENEPIGVGHEAG